LPNGKHAKINVSPSLIAKNKKFGIRKLPKLKDLKNRDCKNADTHLVSSQNKNEVSLPEKGQKNLNR